MSLTAGQIIELLAVKHSKDVFVPECKDGPSYGNALKLRMDAWVMPRSWAKPWVTAYEIKVSRGDFLQDDKWPLYMEYCNSFYFVCPSGLIRADELPADVGLLWVAKTGTRLWTKRKAALRKDVEIPETIWRYVLMCRVKVQRREWEPERPTAERWRQMLEDEEADKLIGRAVGGKVREILSKAREDVHLMQEQVEGYALVQRALRDLGFDPQVPVNEWNLAKVTARLGAALPRDLRYTLSNARDSLERAIEKVKELEGKP